MLKVSAAGSSESIPLKSGESEASLMQRVQEAAARQTSTGKRLADAAIGTGFVGGKGGSVPSADDLAEATRTSAQSMAYPSKIVMQGGSGAEVSPKGWATTVAGADHNFDMILDWDAITFGFTNQVFARAQWYSYYWQVVDVAAAPVDATTQSGVRKGTREASKQDQNVRKAGTFEGLRAKVLRDLGNEAEGLKEDRPDFKATDHPVVWAGKAANLAVQGVSAAWTGIKSLVSAWVTKMMEPENRQAIQFENPGEYVVRVLANSIETGVPEERRANRATSIAAFPVRVLSVGARAREVNKEELTDIRTLEALIAVAEKEASAASDDPGKKTIVADLKKSLAERRTRYAKSTRDLVFDDMIGFDLEIAALEHLLKNKGKTDGLTGGVLNAAMKVRHQMGLFARWQWENRLEDAKKARKAKADQLATADKWSKKLLPDSIVRPRVTLVSEENGSIVRMSMILGQASGSTDANPRWALFDITSPKTQEKYEGTGTLPGPAGHGEAITRAFRDFAEKATYGRGTIAIDLPTLPEAVRAAVPTEMLMKPGTFGRWKKRLQDIVEIAGLVAPFVEGGALATMAGVGGALDAGYRLYDRAVNDRLSADFETLSDLLGVLGPFLDGAKLLTDLKPGAGGVLLKGVVRGGQLVNQWMVPLSIMHDLDQVIRDKEMGGPEKKAAVAMILGRAARDKVVHQVGQQYQHARVAGGTAPPPPTPSPTTRPPTIPTPRPTTAPPTLPTPAPRPTPAAAPQVGPQKPQVAAPKPHETTPAPAPKPRQPTPEPKPTSAPKPSEAAPTPKPKPKPHEATPASKPKPDETAPRPQVPEPGGPRPPAHGGPPAGGRAGGGGPARPVPPIGTGMPPGSVDGLRQMADHFGLVIDVRPPSVHTAGRMAEGAVPKPMEIKSKTINQADRLLGAPVGSIGLVGYFEPQVPQRPARMGDADWIAVTKRYQERLEEFHSLAPDMDRLTRDGRARVANGVVQLVDPRGTAEGPARYRNVTGDLDIWQIRRVDGKPMDKAQAEAVAAYLRPWGIGVEHGAHLRWEPRTAAERKIYWDVISKHSQGAPLIRFEKGQAPRHVDTQTPFTPQKGGSVEVTRAGGNIVPVTKPSGGAPSGGPAPGRPATPAPPVAPPTAPAPERPTTPKPARPAATQEPASAPRPGERPPSAPRRSDETASPSAPHQGTVGTVAPPPQPAQQPGPRFQKGKKIDQDVAAEPPRPVSAPRGATYEKQPRGRYRVVDQTEAGISGALVVIDRSETPPKRYLFKPSTGEQAVPRAEQRGVLPGHYAPRSKAAEMAAEKLGIATPKVKLVEINGRKGSLTEWVEPTATVNKVMSLEDFSTKHRLLYDNMVGGKDFKAAMAGIDALDYLINNLDRGQNLGNYMIEVDQHNNFVGLKPIDHDLTFTSTRGRAVTENWTRDLPESYSPDMIKRLRDLDAGRGAFLESIRPLVGDEAIPGVARRLDELITDMWAKERAKQKAKP